MYLRSIDLENFGPIDRLLINLPFNADGSPQPIVFVGGNGSGKSIVLSHVVNAIIAAQAIVQEDSDVEKGRVFKLRSPHYIKHEKDFSRSEVKFSNDFVVSEIQLRVRKSEFESELG